MNQYFQDVIKVVMTANTSSAEKTQTLRQGKIIRVSKYTVGDDVGFQAQIGTNFEPDLCKMQPIESYRDRDASYIDGKMPFYAEGGQEITVKLTALESKGAATTVFFVFDYEKPM